MRSFRTPLVLRGFLAAATNLFPIIFAPSFAYEAAAHDGAGAITAYTRASGPTEWPLAAAPAAARLAAPRALAGGQGLLVGSRASCASGPGAWSLGPSTAEPCAGRPALAPPIVTPEPRPRPDLATHRLSVFFSVSNCVLVNIQDALEDPFDGDTADDISLAIFDPSWAFWKSGEEIFRRDIVSEYQKSSARPAARAA